MVSFDMTALSTRIPATRAVSAIKERLSQDETLKDIRELPVDQITSLLEICLNTTYLCYNADEGNGHGFTCVLNSDTFVHGTLGRKSD